jgi:CubicO group peptidase (beta-lactamase class C family)
MRVISWRGVRAMAVMIAGAVAAAATAGPGAQPDAAKMVAPAVDDLHEALEAIRIKHKLPGLAAVVLKDGKIVAQGAAGLRREGGTEPITIDDQFHMGSETKAMTATLLAMLVEDGTLSWDTTVGEVFGERFKDMDPAWRGVTIEQLVRHRGGAPSDLSANGLWSKLWQRRGTPSEQRLQLVEGVVTHPPIAPPDTKYLYANAGFAIAGAMAEVKTGKAWETLITERLFAPLGMTSVGFGAPGSAGKEDEPWGHRADGKPMEPGPGADNPAAIGPAGTVHVSLSDWAKFILLHVRGDRECPAREARLLKPETFDILHTPKDNYAMGWLVTKRPWAKGDRPGDTGRVLTHAGSNTLWYAVAWLAPERDAAILVAANRGGEEGTKGTDEAAGMLVGKYLK